MLSQVGCHSRSRSSDSPNLVDNLNELIVRLNIPLPFSLESPFDLTPGLLLGILESILEFRLPISSPIRASRDFPNKVQAMKIFLGVVENDVMGGKDVGLSEIDPRRLAAGEEEEVEFVGELLCWLGRQRGILAGPSREDDLPPSLPLRARHRPASPSTHSTITSGVHSNLSMMPTGMEESDTTVTSIVVSEPLESLIHTDLTELPALPPTPVPSNLASNSSRFTPRCIHEVEVPSFMVDEHADYTAETSTCHCASAQEDHYESADDLPPTPKNPLHFRLDGHINSADESYELERYYRHHSPPGSFSAGRRARSYSGLSASPGRSPTQGDGGSRRIITPHNAPTAEYTLALLNERARLLDELAKIKASPPVVK